MTGRGKFYVLEGADGVGTTTQAHALSALLKREGRSTHVTAEPSGGPIGKLIRQMLSGDLSRQDVHRELALLFAADRLDHVGREIEPKLQQGIDVISDRYLLSSLVYQALDLPLAWIEELNKHAPPPDATVLITLPLDVALARLSARRGQAEIFDEKDVQRRVHERYAELASRVSAIVIEGDASVDEVTARIQRALTGAGRW
jgi:dTMP kinase